MMQKLNTVLFTKQLLNSFKCNNNKLSSFALVYETYGDPTKVVNKVDISSTCDKHLNSNEVLLQYLASPINPADINTIQGVYAVRPKLPAIAGNEGVAKVVKIGQNVNKVKVGDWVIPGKGWTGTWRTHAIVDDTDVILIDNTLNLLSAAQLSVNPCTAYRMLKDFVDLKKGFVGKKNVSFQSFINE